MLACPFARGVEIHKKLTRVITVSLLSTLQICPLTMQNLVLGCVVDLCENTKVKKIVFIQPPVSCALRLCVQLNACYL